MINRRIQCKIKAVHMNNEDQKKNHSCPDQISIIWRILAQVDTSCVCINVGVAIGITLGYRPLFVAKLNTIFDTD